MSEKSKSTHTQSIVAWMFALLALGVAGMLYLENQGIKQQLAQLQQQIILTQPGPGGRKAEDPYVTGPVKNSILKAAKSIQTCYLEYLKTKPSITAGRLKLDWQIDGQGKVFGAGVVQNELGNEALGNCVLGKIASITFPPPPAGLSKYIEHSLHFKEETAPTGKP